MCTREKEGEGEEATRGAGGEEQGRESKLERDGADRE